MKAEGCQVFILDRKVPIVKIVEGSQIFHFDTKQAEKRGNIGSPPFYVNLRNRIKVRQFWAMGLSVNL